MENRAWNEAVETNPPAAIKPNGIAPTVERSNIDARWYPIWDAINQYRDAFMRDPDVMVVSMGAYLLLTEGYAIGSPETVDGIPILYVQDPRVIIGAALLTRSEL